MSVRAVADALHLHPDVVEALEQEDVGRLPPATFVRGYYRAYAKLMDIPGDDLAAAVERLDLEERVPAPGAMAAPAASPGSGPSVAVGLLLVLLAVAVAGAAWWLNQPAPGGADTASPSTAPAQTGSAAEDRSAPKQTGPSDTAEPVAGDATPSQPQADDRRSATAATAGQGDAASEAEATGSSMTTPSPTTDAGPTESEAAAAPSGSGPETAEADAPDDAVPGDNAAGDAQADTGTGPASTTTPAPGGGLTLAVAAGSESWVDIRDANGERLLFGLISGPATRSVRGEEPFTLVIGEAEAVRLQYQGEEVPLARFMRGDVARFQWPPDS